MECYNVRKEKKLFFPLENTATKKTFFATLVPTKQNGVLCYVVSEGRLRQGGAVVAQREQGVLVQLGAVAAPPARPRLQDGTRREYNKTGIFLFLIIVYSYLVYLFLFYNIIV